MGWKLQWFYNFILAMTSCAPPYYKHHTNSPFQTTGSSALHRTIKRLNVQRHSHLFKIITRATHVLSTSFYCYCGRPEADYFIKRLIQFSFEGLRTKVRKTLLVSSYHSGTVDERHCNGIPKRRRQEDQSSLGYMRPEKERMHWQRKTGSTILYESMPLRNLRTSHPQPARRRQGCQ